LLWQAAEIAHAAAEREEQQRELATIQKIEFTGGTRVMNGVYVKSEQAVFGHPVFFKEGSNENICCWYAPNHAW
jgi:hypothetical protein